MPDSPTCRAEYLTRLAAAAADGDPEAARELEAWERVGRRLNPKTRLRDAFREGH
jgi:hypothetical protein